jgi:hypothetical protein
MGSPILVITYPFLKLLKLSTLIPSVYPYPYDGLRLRVYSAIDVILSYSSFVYAYPKYVLYDAIPIFYSSSTTIYYGSALVLLNASNKFAIL